MLTRKTGTILTGLFFTALITASCYNHRVGIIPVPSDFCNYCPTCFDVDKTPTLVKLFVSGIEIGDLWTPDYPLPPNGYWDLEVDPSWPCSWKQARDPDWALHLQSSSTYQELIINYLSTIAFGSSGSSDPCGRHFTNQAGTGEHFVYGGGHAYFSTPSELAATIESITPMIDPDPRMECFPIADKKAVIRYAGKRDATHIYIKLDTDP